MQQIGVEAVFSTTQFNKGLKTYIDGLNKATNATKGMDGNFSKSTSGLSRLGAGLQSAGGSLLKFGALAGGAALAGVGALMAGVGALGAVSIQTAISFQSAFTGVTKTIDGLSDPMGNLTKLGQAVRAEFTQLSKEIPATFEEIAAVGEIGGQLGVGADAISDFTKTVIQLRDTTDLTAEAAATDIARLNGIYNVAAEDMGAQTAKLGSALVALGNTFPTTEAQILNFATRIAGAGQVVGLTQQELFGIGAAFSSVGVESERGGTAVQKVLLGINNAVNATATGFVDYTKQIDQNTKKMQNLQATSARLEAQAPGLQEQILAQYDAFIAAGGSAEEFGRQLGDKTVKSAFDTATAIRDLTNETNILREQNGKPIDSGELAKFAKVAGMSATKFAELWNKDAAGAFQAFVEGLGREGDNAANVLDELGLADQRLVGAFLSLAGAGTRLNDAMALANKGFEEGTALSEEAQKRYATTESQLRLLKNTFRAVGDSIGSRFLPYLNKAVDIGKKLIDKWAGPLADIIDTKVIPAIDNLISTATNLFTAFRAGGLFGFRSGSFGGEGLLAALGIPPDAVSIIENAFNAINEAIAGFQEGGIGGAFNALFSSESAATAITDLIQNISTTLGEQWNSVVLPTLSGWRDRFFDWVTDLYPQIPARLTGLVTSISSTFETYWPTIAASLLTWATQFWDWAEEAALNVATGMSALATALLAWATSGEAQTALTTLGQNIATYLIDAIKLNFTSGKGVLTVMTTLVLGLLAAVGQIAGALIIVGGQVVAGIISGILESLGVKLQPAMFNELSGILSGIAANALTAAKLIGTNIITGIISGLNEKIGELTTTLNQIGFIITQTVSEQLGIQSPSTVFAGIGMNIVQGLIDGIMSMAGSVGGVITDLLGGIFGGAEGGGSSLNLGIDPAAILTGLTEVSTFMTDTIPAAITSMSASFSSFLLLLTEQISELTAGPLLLFVTALSSIYLTHIVMLTEWFTVFFELLTVQLDTITLGSLFLFILSLSNIYLIHIPMMIAGWAVLTAAIMADLAIIQAGVLALIVVLQNTQMVVQSIEVAAQRMGKVASDAAKKAAAGITDSWIPAINKLIKKLDTVIERLQRIRSMRGGGGGASEGLGLQSGTFGFVIPPGFPNDSFPINVQSGETVAVAPRGRSLEGAFLSNLFKSGRLGGGGSTTTYQTVYDIDAPITTVATATDVIQQIDIYKSLYV